MSGNTLSSTLIGSGGRPAHPTHTLVMSPEDIAARCSRCNIYVHSPLIFDECAVSVEEREVRLGQGDFVDRIKLSREAAAIERCHQLPHLMRYSIGLHSHDVVTLVIQSWKCAHNGFLPRAELITAAHFHDHPERVWGDVPSPVKDLMAGGLDMSEVEVLRRLGVDVELTDEELQYLDGADRVELYLWATEEVDRGNRAAQTFVDARLLSFEKRPLPKVLQDLVDEVRQNGLGRLPGDLTREWGGIS
jgi:5'-deoxynucleotidase YfbR-like HD superfamily hydrolase